MLKTNKGFIPIVLVVLVSVGVLVAGGGTYAGVTYAQSSNLIKEGDKLVSSGNYSEAITKYELAKKKWRRAKIGNKQTSTEELKQQKEYVDEGNAKFGKGEWQKCMEYLGKVTSKFPNYTTVQARYTDCQKKLTDEQAAQAAAVQPVSQSSDKSTTIKPKSSSTPTTAKAPALKTVSNSYAKFSFKHPENLAFQEFGGVGSDYYYILRTQGSNNDNRIQIYYTTEPKIGSSDPISTIDDYLAYSAQGRNFKSNYKPQNNRNIGGQPAYYIEHDGTPTKHFYIVFFNNYEIMFEKYSPTLNYDSVLSTAYDGILDTVTFQ